MSKFLLKCNKSEPLSFANSWSWVNPMVQASKQVQFTFDFLFCKVSKQIKKKEKQVQTSPKVKTTKHFDERPFK